MPTPISWAITLDQDQLTPGLERIAAAAQETTAQVAALSTEVRALFAQSAAGAAGLSAAGSGAAAEVSVAQTAPAGVAEAAALGGGIGQNDAFFKQQIADAGGGRQLAGMTAQVAALEAQLDELNRVSPRINTTAAEERLQALRLELTALTDKPYTLEVRAAMAQAQEQIAVVRGEVASLKVAAAESKESLAGMADGFSSMAASMAPLLAAGAIVEGLHAIGEALSHDTALARDWQNALAQIANNAGLTDAQMGSLGTSIGQSAVQFGISGDQLKELDLAAMHAANFGFKSAAEQTAILTPALQSAVSTGGSVEQTTQLLSAALHEYGMNAGQAAQVTDQIHLAASRADSTFQQFAASAGVVLGVAANLHVPIDQVVSALSALTQHGYTADEAATQVKDALSHLVKPSQEAAAEFDALADKTGHQELASKNLVETLSTGGLTAVLNGLHDAYAKLGLTEAEGTEETLKLLNAQRGGLGMATLLGQGAGDYARGLEAQASVLSGAATPTADAYARSLGTVTQQQHLANAATEQLGRTIGQAFLPAVGNTAESTRIVAAAETAFLQTLQQGGSILDAGRVGLQAWGDTAQNVGVEAADTTGKVEALIEAQGRAAASAAQQNRIAFLTGGQAPQGFAAPGQIVVGQQLIEQSQRIAAAAAQAAAAEQAIFQVPADASGLQAWISGLQQIGQATTATAPSALTGLVDAVTLLKTQVPSGMESVRADLQSILNDVAQGGGVSATALHDRVLAELRRLAADGPPAVRLFAQQALEELNTLDTQAAAKGKHTGDAYLDNLVNSFASGMPNLDKYVKGVLSNSLASYSEVAALFGKDAADKWIANMQLGLADGLDATADKLQDSMDGATNSAVEGMHKRADALRQHALDVAKAQGVIGAGDDKKAAQDAAEAQRKADEAARKKDEEAKQAAQKAEEARLTTLRQAAEDTAHGYDALTQSIRDQETELDRAYQQANRSDDIASLQKKIAADEKLAKFAYSSQGQSAAERLPDEENRLKQLQRQAGYEDQKAALEDQATAVERAKQDAAYQYQVAERPGGPSTVSGVAPHVPPTPHHGGALPPPAHSAGALPAGALPQAAAGGTGLPADGILGKVVLVLQTDKGAVVQVIKEVVDGHYVAVELGSYMGAQH